MLEDYQGKPLPLAKKSTPPPPPKTTAPQAPPIRTTNNRGGTTPTVSSSNPTGINITRRYPTKPTPPKTPASGTLTAVVGQGKQIGPTTPNPNMQYATPVPQTINGQTLYYKNGFWYIKGVGSPFTSYSDAVSWAKNPPTSSTPLPSSVVTNPTQAQQNAGYQNFSVGGQTFYMVSNKNGGYSVYTAGPNGTLGQSLGTATSLRDAEVAAFNSINAGRSGQPGVGNIGLGFITVNGISGTLSSVASALANAANKNQNGYSKSVTIGNNTVVVTGSSISALTANIESLISGSGGYTVKFGGSTYWFSSKSAAQSQINQWNAQENVALHHMEQAAANQVTQNPVYQIGGHTFSSLSAAENYEAGQIGNTLRPPSKMVPYWSFDINGHVYWANSRADALADINALAHGQNISQANLNGFDLLFPTQADALNFFSPRSPASTAPPYSPPYTSSQISKAGGSRTLAGQKMLAANRTYTDNWNRLYGPNASQTSANASEGLTSLSNGLVVPENDVASFEAMINSIFNNGFGFTNISGQSLKKQNQTIQSQIAAFYAFLGINPNQQGPIGPNEQVPGGATPGSYYGNLAAYNALLAQSTTKGPNGQLIFTGTPQQYAELTSLQSILSTQSATVQQQQNILNASINAYNLSLQNQGPHFASTKQLAQNTKWELSQFEKTLNPIYAFGFLGGSFLTGLSEYNEYTSRMGNFYANLSLKNIQQARQGHGSVSGGLSYVGSELGLFASDVLNPLYAMNPSQTKSVSTLIPSIGAQAIDYAIGLGELQGALGVSGFAGKLAFNGLTFAGLQAGQSALQGASPLQIAQAGAEGAALGFATEIGAEYLLPPAARVVGSIASRLGDFGSVITEQLGRLGIYTPELEQVATETAQRVETYSPFSEFINNLAKNEPKGLDYELLAKRSIPQLTKEEETALSENVGVGIPRSKFAEFFQGIEKETTRPYTPGIPKLSSEEATALAENVKVGIFRSPYADFFNNLDKYEPVTAKPILSAEENVALGQNIRLGRFYSPFAEFFNNLEVNTPKETFNLGDEFFGNLKENVKIGLERPSPFADFFNSLDRIFNEPNIPKLTEEEDQALEANLQRSLRGRNVKSPLKLGKNDILKILQDQYLGVDVNKLTDKEIENLWNQLQQEGTIPLRLGKNWTDLIEPKNPEEETPTTSEGETKSKKPSKPTETEVRSENGMSQIVIQEPKLEEAEIKAEAIQEAGQLDILPRLYGNEYGLGASFAELIGLNLNFLSGGAKLGGDFGFNYKPFVSLIGGGQPTSTKQNQIIRNIITQIPQPDIGIKPRNDQDTGQAFASLLDLWTWTTPTTQPISTTDVGVSPIVTPITQPVQQTKQTVAPVPFLDYYPFQLGVEVEGEMEDFQKPWLLPAYYVRQTTSKSGATKFGYRTVQHAISENLLGGPLGPSNPAGTYGFGDPSLLFNVPVTSPSAPKGSPIGPSGDILFNSPVSSSISSSVKPINPGSSMLFNAPTTSSKNNAVSPIKASDAQLFNAPVPSGKSSNVAPIKAGSGNLFNSPVNASRVSAGNPIKINNAFVFNSPVRDATARAGSPIKGQNPWNWNVQVLDVTKLPGFAFTKAPKVGFGIPNVAPQNTKKHAKATIATVPARGAKAGGRVKQVNFVVSHPIATDVLAMSGQMLDNFVWGKGKKSKRR